MRRFAIILPSTRSRVADSSPRNAMLDAAYGPVAEEILSHRIREINGCL
jgi:hypothetical protein